MRGEFDKQTEPRCIIFVKTREIAQALLECLKEEQALAMFNINPEYLTGSGTKRTSQRTSQAPDTPIKNRRTEKQATGGWL